MLIDRLLTGPKKSLRLFRPNAPPELNNALQSLSTNGYSVYSLIDDILLPCNSEDPRVKLLRGGMERGAADIRARFFDQNPSGPEGAKKFGRLNVRVRNFLSSSV